MNPIIPLKQRLFSSDLAGVMIGSDDLVRVGRQLKIDLPKKSREALLSTLSAEAGQINQTKALHNLLADLVQRRIDRLLKLCENYPHTLALLGKQPAKAQALINDFRDGAYLD